MTAKTTRINLQETEIPTSWYNIQADLPSPAPPPRHPGTGEPLTPEMLEALFAKELIAQEVSAERYIEIPPAILDAYRIYRPTPLVRATRLEKALKTPAEIWFKNESVNPTGSHKLNSAIAQLYYNKVEGTKRIATETGAGQWGSALSLAGTLFEMPVRVYMVRCSYDQKPYRRILMETWGAEVFASPSNRTESGRKHEAEYPGSPGSLGVAISEAVEDTIKDPEMHYCLGSVLNHVILHQTIIGEEAKIQMERAGRVPDVVIGCVGGGSNYAGLAFPFLREKIAGRMNPRFIAVEPAACPTITRGRLAWDFGDTAQLTPLVKMHTLGHAFVPAAIHSGGLRYHGMAPLVSMVCDAGHIEAVSCLQRAVFEAAILFARSEGLVPAPETAHAVRIAIDEAIRCRESGQKKVILFNLSGHGGFDLSSYEKFLTGAMTDFELPDAEIARSLEKLPRQPE
jgi:tryptophan synthase beta chain